MANRGLFAVRRRMPGAACVLAICTGIPVHRIAELLTTRAQIRMVERAAVE
jgi:hypothetical protein